MPDIFSICLNLPRKETQKMLPTLSLVAVSALLGIGCHSSGAEIPLLVNTHDTFQTMDGFGACIVDYDTLPAYQDPAFYDRAVFDMGLTILRIPLIGIEVDKNDNEDPLDFDLSTAETENLEYTMEIARQFQARGIRHILGTPWSPPGWMKTNRSGILGGRLRPDMREEYAEYLDAYVALAELNFGVTIDTVSLQNELLFVEPYESCVYNPLQLRETLRVVSRRFKERARPVDLLVSEEMGWAERFILYLEPLMADPETRSFEGSFASHGWAGFQNWQKMGAMLAPYGKKLWMTETSGQNPDWEGGLALADSIHNVLAGGNASAYIYWQFSSARPSRSSYMAAGEYTPKGYAAKHFTRFIRPGAQRVYVKPIERDLLTSAYKHPESGELTVVIVNKGIEAVSVDLEVVDPLLPLNWLIFTSSEGHYLEAGNRSGKSAIHVPAKGIVTLYGKCGESLEGLDSLVPEGWKAPPIGKSVAKDGGVRIDERLHAAARANDRTLVKALLDEGLNPNAINVGGFSPMHRAAWPGHMEVLDPLLAGGANPNVRDRTGGSPIIIAAGNGHDAFIEKLISEGAEVDLQNTAGMTALHRAAQSGQMDAVRTLVNLGADPCLTDNQGWNSLHWAAASFSSASDVVLRYLLEAGADATARDRENRTPLHIAAANCVNPRIGGRPGRVGKDGDFINAERLQALVEGGAPVNAQDDKGRTALHWIAWMGETKNSEEAGRRPTFSYSVEGIRYLLAAGADPEISDHQNRTPADYAASEEYHATVSLLRGSGNHSWLLGSTANSSSSELEILPDPAQSNSRLNRQLRQAAMKGNLFKVRNLMAEGADPDALGFSGGSALHNAVIGGHLELVKFLVGSGANLSIRDSDGYTALDRARQNQEVQITRFLLKELDHQ